MKLEYTDPFLVSWLLFVLFLVRHCLVGFAFFNSLLFGGVAARSCFQNVVACVVDFEDHLLGRHRFQCRPPASYSSWMLNCLVVMSSINIIVPQPFIVEKTDLAHEYMEL